jgi:hypothetical protein
MTMAITSKSQAPHCTRAISCYTRPYWTRELLILTDANNPNHQVLTTYLLSWNEWMSEPVWLLLVWKKDSCESWKISSVLMCSTVSPAFIICYVVDPWCKLAYLGPAFSLHLHQQWVFPKQNLILNGEQCYLANKSVQPFHLLFNFWPLDSLGCLEKRAPNVPEPVNTRVTRLMESTPAPLVILRSTRVRRNLIVAADGPHFLMVGRSMFSSLFPLW